MPRFPTLLALCALIAFQPNAGAAEQGRKLTLDDGDRVLLIGDVLMERENNYGVLETKMRQEFPGKKFAVRNLGYSGDTPLGASRASFDPVAKGVAQLEEQLAISRLRNSRSRRPKCGVLPYVGTQLGDQCVGFP